MLTKAFMQWLLMQPFRMSSFISVVQKEMVQMGNVNHVKCAGGCEQKHAS